MNKIKLSEALSDSDIRNFFMNKINIIKFSELSDYEDLNEVLGKYKRCIILFESEKIDQGHWVALTEIQQPNKKPYILFADSYGVEPESEFNYIPKSFQYMSDQVRGTLIKLLIDQPLQVHFNQYRLQKLGKLNGHSVNTCGKWAILFNLLNNITEDEFNKIIRSFEKEYKLEPDVIICLLYEALKNDPNRLNIV